MLVAEKSPLKDIQEYMPLGCTESPAHNSAFCKVHTKIVADMGYATNVREFITSCGGNPSNYTRECKDKVKEVLQTILRAQSGDIQTETADLAQGTRYLLRNQAVTNEDNFQYEEEADDVRCQKNTGQIHRLHHWSRGIFQVVSGGGHIDYWIPLYDSEGPHQVAFILIKYLQLKLKGKTQEEIRQFYLSYDHMCAIDRLKLLRNPLPFEPPEDRLWLDSNHLIDPLHLKNHKRKECQELYNPEKLKNHLPDGNLMCAVTRDGKAKA